MILPTARPSLPSAGSLAGSSVLGEKRHSWTNKHSDKQKHHDRGRGSSHEQAGAHCLLQYFGNCVLLFSLLPFPVRNQDRARNRTRNHHLPSTGDSCASLFLSLFVWDANVDQIVVVLWHHGQLRVAKVGCWWCRWIVGQAAETAANGDLHAISRVGRGPITTLQTPHACPPSHHTVTQRAAQCSADRRSSRSLQQT